LSYCTQGKEIRVIEHPKRYECVKGTALWFTGLPSSGKTTIANHSKAYLESFSIPTIVLDGDVIRPIIAGDIDYSSEGRLRSLHKYIQLTNVLIQANIIVMLAVNNHCQKQRDIARKSYPVGHFAEIWVDTPLELCVQRDVKGLYEKAKRGEIQDIVGISIEYETPQHPDIVITTQTESPSEASRKIFYYLRKTGIIAPVI
jgi:adenylyl-sulfate kinase